MTVQTVMGRATHGFAGHMRSTMKSTCFRSLGQTGTVPAVQETVILYTKLYLMTLSARMVNCLSRKLVDHPKIFRWQNTFKKCNPPDFNFFFLFFF